MGKNTQLAFTEALVQVMWLKGLVTLKERDATREILQQRMLQAGI